jgi:hypothetical protein|tara:strand:+ start:1807 stop:1944 length:138 start_codon:yes stop_codon:yes gene_type:complete
MDLNTSDSEEFNIEDILGRTQIITLVNSSTGMTVKLVGNQHIATP